MPQRSNKETTPLKLVQIVKVSTFMIQQRISKLTIHVAVECLPECASCADGESCLSCNGAAVLSDGACFEVDEEACSEDIFFLKKRGRDAGQLAYIAGSGPMVIESNIDHSDHACPMTCIFDAPSEIIEAFETTTGALTINGGLDMLGYSMPISITCTGVDSHSSIHSTFTLEVTDGEEEDSESFAEM